jgi:hypothetical protein
MTSAIESSETVYTFSFTTDWFHTLHEVAPTRAPPIAAPCRAHRLGTMPRSQRSATRNQNTAAPALVTAANRLIRTAYDSASGSSPKTWARTTNSGFPGGCGMPSTRAAAIYSDASQNAVVGASVSR